MAISLLRRVSVLETKPCLRTPDQNFKATFVRDTNDHIQLRAAVVGWALAMKRQTVIDSLYGDSCSDLLDANHDELEAKADISHT